MKINTSKTIKVSVAWTALAGMFLLNALLLFLCPVGPRSAASYLAKGWKDTYFVIGLICLLVFVACLVLSVCFVVYYFINKDNKFGYLRTASLVNFISAIIVSAASMATNLRFYPFLFIMMALLLFAAVSVCAIKPKVATELSPAFSITTLKQNIKETGQTYGSIAVVWAALAILFVHSFVLLYMPLGSASVANSSHYLVGVRPSVASVFANFVYYNKLYQFFAIFMVVLMVINCVLLLQLIIKFFTDTHSFLKFGKIFGRYNIGLTFVMMGFSLILLFMAKASGKAGLFVTPINVVIAYVFYTLFLIFGGRAKAEAHAKANKTEIKPSKRSNKLTELVFVGVMTVITFASFFVRLYSIKITSYTPNYTLSEAPYEVMLSLKAQSPMGNAVSFLLLVMCILSAILLVFTLLNYLVDSEEYKSSALLYSYANLFFQFLYMAAGLFYILVVPAFDGIFNAAFGHILDELIPGGFSLSQHVKINTLAFIPFVLGLVTIIFMHLFCWQKNQKVLAQESSSQVGADITAVSSPSDGANEGQIIDPCPTFSDLDSQVGTYNQELKKRLQTLLPDPSLALLTRFVVGYAAHMPERLSYTLDSVATFIAGMGASRLAILQGMSGTGKTSLPKAFMQAIGGNCEIVEVESSWRDKNELLGYYNEFNGIYTPKKFTQYLYKAALNPQIPTFIVLDELNLSRIEYYFSDFLSLMEARENDRAITLLNKRIYPSKPTTGDTAKPSPYLALTDGNTLKIPPNVWFIGTANRDESTFEISDKVYDRAQTMNFDRRAPKVTTPRQNVPSRFVDYPKLKELFDKAKKAEFDAEADSRILAVEKLLLPYKISFGNRILRQIEDFVKVYMACFDTSTEEKYRTVQHRAIENILYSKVLRKLELKVVENKAQLIQGFEKINFNICAQFIRQLDEN